MIMRNCVWLDPIVCTKCCDLFLYDVSGTYGVARVVNDTAKDILTTTLTPLLSAADEDESETSESLQNCSLPLTTSNSTDALITPIGMRKVTNLADIPAKEIIIVLLMLGLWIYSIILTRKAWYRILKE